VALDLLHRLQELLLVVALVHYVYQHPVVQDQVVLIQYIAVEQEDGQDQAHLRHLQEEQVGEEEEQVLQEMVVLPRSHLVQLDQPSHQKVEEEQEALVILGHLTLLHMVAVAVEEHPQDILLPSYQVPGAPAGEDKVEFPQGVQQHSMVQVVAAPVEQHLEVHLMVYPEAMVFLES
jgi:hypothetical protein